MDAERLQWTPRAVAEIPDVGRKNGLKNFSGLETGCAFRMHRSSLSQKLFKDFLATLATREMKQLNL